MTHYTVVWVESALDELAELWLRSDNRNEVTAAADLIDNELRDDAQLKGIEQREDLRALFAPPLRILFTVRENDRIVEVLRILPL